MRKVIKNEKNANELVLKVFIQFGKKCNSKNEDAGKYEKTNSILKNEFEYENVKLEYARNLINQGDEGVIGVIRKKKGRKKEEKKNKTKKCKMMLA